MKSSRLAGGCDDDTPTDSSTSTADEGADISKIIERKRALLARKRRKRQRQSRNRPVKTRFLTQRLMADGFTLRPTNNQVWPRKPFLGFFSFLFVVEIIDFSLMRDDNFSPIPSSEFCFWNFRSQKDLFICCIR